MQRTQSTLAKFILLLVGIKSRMKYNFTAMRWLIHYLRQVFCKHTFVQVETVEYKNQEGFVVNKYNNYICSKCLYVRRVKIK